MRKSLIILIVLWTGTVFVSGRTYFVNGNTGSDSHTGTSAETAWRTITKAAQQVQAGDEVCIASGTYSESNICPGASGSATEGMIVFRPLTDTDAVVLTIANNTSEDASKPIFNLANRSYIRIEGIRFANMTYHAACVSMNTSHHCVVSGCRFEHLGQEAISPTGGTAMVWLSNCSWCVVENNDFRDCYGDGISYTGSTSHHLLICRNTFSDMKGKQRSWASEENRYSSAVNGTVAADVTNGNNLICCNAIRGGQDGIWIDRGCSRNIIVRNRGDGGQRLVFVESRCDSNLIQENIACNMTESGFRSALYSTTGWTTHTRWLHNIAYKCAKGIYLHKALHNEVRGNIAFECTNYSLHCTDSAVAGGNNIFRSNLWYSSSKSKTMHYCGTAMTAAAFGAAANEIHGIYNQTPKFVYAGGSDFRLQSTSPCIGAGENGVDIGAYAVYAPQTVGCESSYHRSTIQVGFDQLITDVQRGEDVVLTLRLATAPTESVEMQIQPVAGDLIPGTDYTLSAQTLTFEAGQTEKEISVHMTNHPASYAQLLVLQAVADGLCGRTYTALRVQANESMGTENIPVFPKQSGRYNLLGQKVDEFYHGIVIYNGQKILQ